ncbi:TIGR01440 family protein [Cohnella sp. CFH 77786]|uniref:TIGR01440 family protein n=1 Tax=Cohnella sp. CFH 77786 TaxID=2662265 RepID=UPI001C60ED26|nr:TIGR01440 family protein [Cohnella sp. CFH 77786]MBW5445951.1 TIGR01440 family protein [Cohnella sp. CFH 77786]
METEQRPIADLVEQALDELAAAGGIRSGRLVVIGTSTSEVQGRRIGTSGTEAVASAIYDGVDRVRSRIGFDVVWQCCEHLNRALVAERSLAEAMDWTIVSAVPVPKAGGSMAAYAYRQMKDPCLVESVRAHAGLDIGETLIGMHLRAVAVPFRPSVRFIGEARLTAAYSRPKLIGGARAVYQLPAAEPPSDTCE